MYKFVEHTADIKVKVIAKTFEQLLKEALEATIEIVKTPAKGQNFLFTIHAEGSTYEDIVVNTISELISYCEINEVIPVKVEKLSITNNKVRVVLIGKKGFMNSIIKAVTYHNLKVEHNGKWKVEIVYDI